MKKFNKVVSLLLVLAMVFSLAACGDKKASNDTKETPAAGATKAPADEATKAPDAEATAEPEATPEATVPPNTVQGDETRDDAFYVYCWNGDVMNNVIKYFNEAYPEDAKRIVYVDTGGSNFYQTKIDALLEDVNNKQYPDMIAMEMDYIMKYTEITLPVSDLGITADDMKNMYQYTIDAATFDGQVKGLSWQAAPGAMMYRRSLAKKYLGTDDPEKVQEYFKDWDTMLTSGKTILDKSKGETKLFSGVDDVKRVFQAGRTNAWYDDASTLSVDQVMLDYMDYAKQLYDSGLTNNTTQWSDAWSSNAATDNTFAYMGCTWFLHWCLKAYSGGEAVGEGTFGDWAMCAGPQAYYWGGTWLGATPGCSDKELAGRIMKAATCDTTVMKEICKGSLDYVNNKEAIAALQKEGVGKYEFLGGQDFLEYFAPLAEAIKLPAMCAEDFYITQAFDNQILEFTNGNKDKETAIADFKAAVLDTYTYLTAE